MKRVAALVLLFLLASCSSIPLGTLWRLSGMGWQDVAYADTREVRAAILLPESVSVVPDSVALIAELRDDDSDEFLVEALAGLALREQGAQVITPLPGAGSGQHWFVFSLDEDGRRQFQDFQDVLAREKTAGRSVKFEFSVSGKFTRPDGMESTELSLWLKLADEDDWLEIIDTATVEFGKHHEITD